MEERQLTVWLHWITQFTLATSIPSWDLVHGTQNVALNIGGELCLCYVLCDNISSIIVSNVHGVLGDVRVHTNVAIAHWRVRWAPFYDWSNGWRVNIDVKVFRWRKMTCERPYCRVIASDLMQKQSHVNNSREVKWCCNKPWNTSEMLCRFWNSDSLTWIVQ